MCEYCGCQQIATIAQLCREHDAVVTQVGRIQSGRAGHRREDIATGSGRPWISSLHAVVEQEGLFPEMSDEFPDHIKVLRFERREIEKVLRVAIHGIRDDRTWPDRLVAVLHLLRGHILKDGVFPAALAVLGAD